MTFSAKKSPYIILLGNEKGGTGKSTLAMHIIVSLLYKGFSVGSIDVDARQGTLSRYIENRKIYQEKINKDLLTSQHYRLLKSTHPHQNQAEQEEEEKFLNILEHLKSCDFIVIDTPGSDTFLSRKTHSHANLLITPLNDSFVDLDLLALLGGSSDKILGPSTYAEMVWEQRKQKSLRGEGSIEWIVLRNRLSNVQARNKQEMEKALKLLSKRVSFRLCAGFGERVVFRELFLSGLTLLDIEKSDQLTLSHVTARQELRNLMGMIPVLENYAKAS